MGTTRYVFKDDERLVKSYFENVWDKGDGVDEI